MLPTLPGMHASSFENMQKCFEKYAPIDPTGLVVVDIGAAEVNGSYRRLFEREGTKYIGLDLQPGPGVDVVMDDPYKLPLPSASADIVLSAQMLEHCELFWVAFQEMVRVTKPDGLILLIVPSGGPIHRYPVDCYRFYPDAMQALAKFANVHLVECWHDDRGPWKDVVGVFSPTPRKAQRGPLPRPALPRPRVPGPSADPTEELMRGKLPYRDVLRALHEVLAPEVYIEIGIRHGESLALARKRAIGVDPYPDLRVPLREGTTLIEQTSDWFFELNAREHLAASSFDLAFIDGMHLFEYALRDFMNLERHAHPKSVIVVDDIFPNHPAQAARERRTQVWTGDVWKLVPALRRYRPNLFLCSLDTHPTGLLLIAGLDPNDRSLHESYNQIVREHAWTPMDPPAAILERRGALPGMERDLVQGLAELRAKREQARAGGTLR